MNNKDSILYTVLSKILSKDELYIIDQIMEETSSRTGKLEQTKLRENEKNIFDIKELDPDGHIRKLHKGVPWSSDEAEEESWGHFKKYVERVGVPRFLERRLRPRKKTSNNMKLCLNRSKFKRRSQEQINKLFKSNYKVGDKNDTE
jgi:hypothetical protein